MDLISANITSAEDELNELFQRLNISRNGYDDLVLDVETLISDLQEDLRVLFEEVIQELADQVRFTFCKLHAVHSLSVARIDSKNLKMPPFLEATIIHDQNSFQNNVL